jgi:hypothetical protein
MVDDNIVMFVGMFLNEFKYVTAIDLQKYIIERPEVGKVISISQIENVLDNFALCKVFRYLWYN